MYLLNIIRIYILYINYDIKKDIEKILLLKWEFLNFFKMYVIVFFIMLFCYCYSKIFVIFVLYVYVFFYIMFFRRYLKKKISYRLI